MTLLGMAGGSFEERARFCAEADLIPAYWYVADTGLLDAEHREAARRAGTRLAFHPHAFLAYDRVHPIAYLDDPEYSEVAWLPDTAHMTMMGGGFGILERMLSSTPERIAAIHLKDWDPAYGRSYHRYAKGFAPLGRGIVPLERVASMIARGESAVWVVVEQDYAKASPGRAIRAAVRWIQSHGLDADGVLRVPEPLEETLPVRIARPAVSDRLPALAATLAAASAESVEEANRTIAGALRDYFDCDAVAMHAYRPGRDLAELFSLLALATRTANEATDFPDLVPGEGSALSRCVASRTPLLENDSERVRTTLLIPVLNRFNHHHIRLVVEARWDRSDAAWDLGDAYGLAELLAESADGALDDACGYAMGKVQGIASRRQSLEILDEIRDLVRDLLECEGVTVFLANPAGDRLDPWSTTGIAWRDDLPLHRRFYGPHTDPRSPTMRVWRQREILTMVNGQETPHEPTSNETGVSGDRDNILMAPLVGTTLGPDGEEWTEAIGIVRCRNKRVRPRSDDGSVRGPTVRCFNQDDAAVLDAICQAAVPHIRLLVADVRRRKAVADMTHELSKPVNAVRAAVDKLRSDLGRIDRAWLDLVDTLGPGTSEVDRRALR
ncbi:MAG: sugar phosphate isomerase/epimerase family protein, partial [Armatimonadota bacterium]